MILYGRYLDEIKTRCDSGLWNRPPFFICVLCDAEISGAVLKRKLCPSCHRYSAWLKADYLTHLVLSCYDHGEREGMKRRQIHADLLALGIYDMGRNEGYKHIKSEK